MTGRTHDLAAFTALNLVVVTQPLVPISLPTMFVALTANFIGGLTPDIDQPTADLWRRLPAGTLFGKLFSPFLMGHRSISHSILGLILFGIGSSYLLTLIHSFLLVDMQIVWWAFMIGYFSHLIMDTITVEGVPWLFPIPIKFGIPPIKVLRVKTGGIIEKYGVFPALLFLDIYLIYMNYVLYLDFFKNRLH